MPIGKNFYFLSFDLNLDNLKLYYQNKNINQAWDDIKRFMKKNGFEHNQYSAYISKDRMSRYDIRDFMESMYKKLPWFPLCANRVMLSERNSQEKLLTSIAKIKAIRILIDKLKANPPGQTRGISSAQNPPVQQKTDTVTVSLSDLREYFEAGAEMKVTVKRSDLKATKKQAESKQQKKSQTENPPEQGKAKKPKR